MDVFFFIAIGCVDVVTCCDACCGVGYVVVTNDGQNESCVKGDGIYMLPYCVQPYGIYADPSQVF